MSFDYNTAITGRSDQYSDSGTHPPQTLVFTRNFTYGVPFDLRASIWSLLDMPDGSSGSANLFLRCAGYSVNASNYTGSSTAGTTRGTMLAPNAAYDGIVLANTRNFQSTVRSVTTLENSLTYLTMNYKRRKGATDVTFSPQFDSELKFWTNGFNISIVDNLDGSETVTDRDNTPTQDLTGKRFARIQVSP